MVYLKDCPFCGGKAEANERAGGWTIDCENTDLLHSILDGGVVYCLCGAMFELCSTEEKAAEVWNKRPIEEKLQEEITWLRKRLERLE